MKNVNDQYVKWTPKAGIARTDGSERKQSIVQCIPHIPLETN